jgi:5-methylcytosine-specific restriction endonuclease McrA
MERLRKKADDLFFEACRKKYGDKCLICGRLYDKAHHFFPKGQYQHLRYDLDNGINLCMVHHSMIHQTGLRKEVENMIIGKRGNDWFNNLRKKANNMLQSFKNKKWYEQNIIRLKKYLNEK